MERLAKNLIFVTLITSAMFAAGLSSASDGKANYHEVEIKTTAEKNPVEKNNEFWDKFRESVMPDDKDKGKIPNYEKPSEPPPEHHQPPPRH